jgi:hypothetical protein
MLSLDEKSQIQGLDRTQTGLPLKKGRAALSGARDLTFAGVAVVVETICSAFQKLQYPARLGSNPCREVKNNRHLEEGDTLCA